MTSDVLGSQIRATECELNCPPLPASLIDTLPALLAIVIAPETGPVADGANVTFNAAVCPGGTVVFAPTPLALKPGPVASTLLMVAFAFPVFVSVTPSELVLPTNTLAKSKLPVLALSSGADVTPLPLVEIASGELGASLTSEIDPVTLPAELGMNTTLKVVFCPAAMLIGTVSPEMANPAPVTLALEIVTLAVPGFCSMIVCELLEPVATAAKAALMGVAESCGCTCGCGVFGGGGVAFDPLLPEAFDPATTPAQPFPSAAVASINPNRHTEALFRSDLLSAIVRQV
jgi:hypothetical protein